MLRVSGIKLSLDEDKEKISYLAAKLLGLKSSDILQWRIVKESVDARKGKIHLVYTVDVKVRDERYIFDKINNFQVSGELLQEYEYVTTGLRKLSHRPVIVGMGPAGLFTGLILAEMGYFPIILERGNDVDTRVLKVQNFWNNGSLDSESNVQFGEGGAGTFSDGKLTTRIKDRRCSLVLKELVQAGGPPEILYAHKPHIGTDVLRIVVKNLRRKIESLGGEIRFQAKLTDIEIHQGALTAIRVNDQEKISCSTAIIAVGHSARDTFNLLYKKGVQIISKPFSVGVRIEHPQDLINRSQYGNMAGHPKLGPAEYKLTYHSPKGRSAYTFCMCPGGLVVAAASEAGGVATNGMSYHDRSGRNANSALLVGVNPEDFPSDHPLAGIEFQRIWEYKAYGLGSKPYYAPAQLVGDFMKGKVTHKLGQVCPTYSPGVSLTKMEECLPPFVIQTLREAIADFGKKIKGFDMDEGVLTGVETRSSSPVRIVRSDNYEASIQGLYPAGEGAGYAGGIVSAAVDGVRCAEAIARAYKPLR